MSDQPTVLRTTKIGNGFVKEDVLAYVDELNSQIYALQEENNNLKKRAESGGGLDQAKVDEYESELSRLRGELGTTKNQLRAAQEELDKRPVITGEGGGSEQLAAVQQELTDAKADLEAVRAELQMAQDEAGETTDRITQLEATINTLNEDNATLRNELAAATAAAASAGGASEEVAAQIEAMQARLMEAEKEASSLRSELDAKNTMMAEQAGMSSEADLQKLAEYEAMLAEQSSTLAEREREIENLKQQVEDLQENGGDSSVDMGALFMEAQMTAKKVASEARKAADKKIADAEATAKKTVADAEAKAKKTIEDANAQAEQTIADANAQADETIKNANAEAEQKLNDADAQAVKTVADAEESVRASIVDAEKRTKTTTETARTVRALLRSEIDSVAKKFNELSLVLENLSGQATSRLNEAKNVIGDARGTINDDDDIPAFDSFDDVATSFGKNAKSGSSEGGEFNIDDLAEQAGDNDGWTL